MTRAPARSTPPADRVAVADGRTAVSYSGEFRRIEALPRRRWEEEPDARELLDAEVGLGGMHLWPVQAAALRDIALHRGGFLPVGVGQGKALVSLLAPVVLEAKRPVLFVPAALREQTLQFVLPRMRRHWRLHPGLRVVGYSELSLAKNAHMLEDLEPDLIILDEVHSVANPRAGRTRRLVRWFREHPETLCVAMSGTISLRSIRDYAHIIRWCLKDSAPVPEKWVELTEWADALDEKVPDQQRVAPGALERFCRPGENARQGFRRRLTETPGVVATQDNLLGASLRLDAFPLEVPPRVAGMIHAVRNTWTTPNGDLISEAVDLWRHLRELALGFWLRWDPPAPPEWLEARSAWKSFARETLANNRRQLDTELQVWNECARGVPGDHPWHLWADLKDTFQPNTVPEWVDDFALRAAARWLEEPGICWTEHVAFGRALAERAGVPYFGAGDDGILSTTAPAIVASIRAHGEGKNLQRWSRNLVLTPPTSGKVFEQVLGRTHREGQLADEVTCEVGVHLPELRDSLAQAFADARYLEDTLGGKQKLNSCDLCLTLCDLRG